MTIAATSLRTLAQLADEVAELDPETMPSAMPDIRARWMMFDIRIVERMFELGEMDHDRDCWWLYQLEGPSEAVH